MSIEDTKKPHVYWVSIDREYDKSPEKHELPENAVLHFWDKKKKAYIEVWIDPTTGDIFTNPPGGKL